MFGKARLKLTAWYLLIIMAISISFSVAMYRVLTGEFERVQRIQQFRQQHVPPPPPNLRVDQDSHQNHFYSYVLDPELVEETKGRILIMLLLINGGILVLSSLAGYFLAGVTLKPIQEMVDEQNRFITDASHELRTPITSLRTELEVSLRDKKISPTTKEILTSNLEDVNALQILADKLIHLAQYQKNISNLSIVSLKEVLQDSVKKVSSLGKHKHITFKTAFADATLKGDKSSLTELFVIFLDNAVKYSKKNTIVYITADVTSKQAKIQIADEGIGIPEKDLPHIFERFYKVDKSRSKTTSDGFGLGLSIAKQIIEQHGGTIQVKSTEEKGTTFTITLPVVE